MNNKGFANVIFIGIVILLLAGAGYWYWQDGQASSLDVNSSPIPTQSNSISETTTLHPTLIPVSGTDYSPTDIDTEGWDIMEKYEVFNILVPPVLVEDQPTAPSYVTYRHPGEKGNCWIVFELGNTENELGDIETNLDKAIANRVNSTDRENEELLDKRYLELKNGSKAIIYKTYDGRENSQHDLVTDIVIPSKSEYIDGSIHYNLYSLSAVCRGADQSVDVNPLEKYLFQMLSKSEFPQ